MSTIDPDLQLAYFGRGLSRERLTALNARLPDTHAFRRATLTLEPNFIAMECAPGTGRERIPTAAICLRDVAHALSEARYAEAQATVALEIWRSVPGDMRVAITQAQYYCADATHRLYAAGEHLAVAILCILNIERKALNVGKIERAVSLQARLARHLRMAHSTERITSAVLKLGGTSAWQRSIEYRGDWVHNQAPILEGIGQSFDRNVPRWHVVTGADGGPIGHQMSVGGGDPSETSIETVLSDSIAATSAFLELSTIVLDEYIALLAQVGVQVNLSQGATSITLFNEDEAPGDTSVEA